MDGPLTIAAIQERVCALYGLPLIEMHSARRGRNIVRPRQVAMYLATRLTLKSLPQIGRAFGGRDHTTVMHARDRIEALRLTHPEIDAAVAELAAELSNEGARP